MLSDTVDRRSSLKNIYNIVFDPCMGSGSHGLVAVQNGRNFIGIELDEQYFEIAKKRIESIKEQGA